MFTESFFEEFVGDTATIDRGRAYAERVSEVTLEEQGEHIVCRTAFKGMKTHEAELFLSKEAGALEEAGCTCPQEGVCTHIAALGFAVLERYKSGELEIAGETYSGEEGIMYEDYEVHFFLEKEDVDENSFLSACIKLSVGEGQQKEYLDISPYFMELLRSKSSLGGGYGTMQPSDRLPLAESEDGPMIEMSEGVYLAYDDRIGEQIMEAIFSPEDLTRATLFIDAKEPKLIFPFGSPYLIAFLQRLEQGTKDGEWTVHRGKKVVSLSFNKEELSLFYHLERKGSMFTCRLRTMLGTREISAYEFDHIFQTFHKFIEFREGEYIEVLNKKECSHLYHFLEHHQAEVEEDIYVFHAQLWHLPEMMYFLDSIGGGYDGTEDFEQCWREMQARKGQELPLAPHMENVLRSYQKEGVYWGNFLRAYGFGGILADDMGLGKTLQVLTLVDAVQTPFTTIIIAPKTLIHNWKNEIEKFYPGKTYVVVDGSVKERKEQLRYVEESAPDFVLTSYGTLLKDINHYEQFEKPFEYVVLDEAHYIKNHKTKIANSVKRLQARHRLAITGTPLENSVTDLWSLFDFLMPGFLGDSSEFKRKYETPIMRKGQGRVLEMLSAKMRPFMLRRTKDLVMKELPPKIEQTIYCDLSSDQARTYIDICKKAKGEIQEVMEKKGFARSRIEILAALNRMRQVCNHPAMLDLENRDMESAKFETLFPLLEEAMHEGRKVLLFSSFVKTLKLLEDECKRRGIEYAYLDGQTKNREAAIKKFTDEKDTRLFLVSMKVGGVGLNLTVADVVVLFDPWWNPTVEMQAVDRAHRMGQTNTVNVYSFVTKNTLEEKICKLKENKRALFDSAVGENDGVIKNLNWDDMKDLFDSEDVEKLLKK